MMHDNGDALPHGWAWTTLGEACTVIMGQSPPSETYNTKQIGLPFYQGKAEFGDLYPTPAKWCSEPSKIAEADDILISVRAPVGPTNLCFERSCIGRGLAAIRPQADMIPRYFLYLLRWLEPVWEEKATGTTFSAISGEILRSQAIPLAPLNEQRRIVEAIETQFTRLDVGIAALQRLRKALKLYKAAVLKAACEGQLVPQDPGDEPAAELLKRILAERRAKWEADQRAKGKDPAKLKYEAPATPDTSDLPELPPGWVWASVAECAADEPRSITDGPFGSNLKTEHYTTEGARVIRLQNIGDGEFLNDNRAFISFKHFEKLLNHQVFSGDLVIAALGEVLPRACIVPDSIDAAIVKADCIRFKPHFALARVKYLNAALNSEVLHKAASRLVHGIGRPRLNQQEIKMLPLPLPSLPEQDRIVEALEAYTSDIEQLENIIEASMVRAERLRQSILKEAFAGRLVAQDPHDEPASALLERVKRERSKRG